MALNVTTGDEGWKKPKTGDEVSMSMKVTKVYGSVDENNGLKYTVDDKSLGLLSTTIDKALGSMQESFRRCSSEQPPCQQRSEQFHGGFERHSQRPHALSTRVGVHAAFADSFCGEPGK